MDDTEPQKVTLGELIDHLYNLETSMNSIVHLYGRDGYAELVVEINGDDGSSVFSTEHGLRE